MGTEKITSETILKASSTDLHQQTLVYLAAGLKDRKFSSVELTQTLLEWVEKMNPTINSFVTITRDQALDQARAADELIAHGRGGPLTGIPVAHKDIFCTQGVKTACGSKMLDNFISPYDATVVARIKQAGMVMLGKTNMDEFAMGSSTETSYYGATKNPWDYAAVPGGSSGGSAAAVAARMVPAATASDTGGSIRQPASFCGVTGIKPTYGRVSRYGMIAYASSLDQGGVIAKTAEDCALLLAAMAGFDPRDSTSVDNDATLDFTATLNESVSGRKIGVPKEWFESLQPEVKVSVEAAIQEFERLGAQVMEIELPHSPMSIASYYVIAMAEASSNLSRYDGVRFGHRCEDPVNLDDLYGRSRTEGFGAEVKRRIMVGAYALSAGYYDQYYLKAQQVRRLISEDFTRAFEKVDFIMGPVAPTTAFDLGENLEDPVQMYLSDIFTLSLNLSGRPGMSVPVGFDARRRPVGLQIIGDFWKEAELLNMAHIFQQHTSWHEEVPSNLV